VQFVAGYGDTAASVPAGIKQAALLLCGMYYLNPAPTPDLKGHGFALDALLARHKIPAF
jgi:hypothetical protein